MSAGKVAAAFTRSVTTTTNNQAVVVVGEESLSTMVALIELKKLGVVSAIRCDSLAHIAQRCVERGERCALLFFWCSVEITGLLSTQTYYYRYIYFMRILLTSIFDSLPLHILHILCRERPSGPRGACATARAARGSAWSRRSRGGGGERQRQRRAEDRRASAKQYAMG